MSDLVDGIHADSEGQFPSTVAEEWSALADVVGAPPWLRPQWVSIWWRAFGVGRLTLLCARRGTQLVGVAPTAQTGRLLTSPTNYHSPGYEFLALDEPAAIELAGLALRQSRRTTFSFIDPDACTQHALVQEARRRRHLCATRSLEHPPYVVTVGDWTAYETRLDPRLTRDLRRRERRLGEQGRFTFTVDTGEANLMEQLEKCFETEAASWKGQAGTAMTSHSATRFFYTAVAEFASSRKELMLAFLKLDGQTIAMQLNITNGNTVTVLKLGHDDAYSRFAPGKLLIRNVLRDCFAGPTTCYDFSGHSNAYKMEWADGSRPLIETRTYFPSVVGITAWGTRRFGVPLAKRLLGQ